MQQRKTEAQEFDKTLKALFGAEAPDILPRLLPYTEYIGEQNIEIDRTIVKADLVYKAHLSVYIATGYAKRECRTM